MDSRERILDATLACLEADGRHVPPERKAAWHRLLDRLCVGEATPVPIVEIPSVAKGLPSLPDGPVCLRGLDDVFLRDDWEEFLLDQCRAKNVLAIAFGNRLGCGTALGVSWCLAGGRGLCAAFAGTGGLPALEETVMALHVDGSFHGDTRALSDMREWFEEETGQSLPGGKAVVGSLIFAVESGIHVDGIAKDPRLYEPFPPELVGGRRRLCLGTHSGRTSLEICCGLLGLPLDGDRIDAMLDRVRELGAERERPLFPEEIADIVGAAAR